MSQNTRPNLARSHQTWNPPTERTSLLSPPSSSVRNSRPSAQRSHPTWSHSDEHAHLLSPLPFPLDPSINERHSHFIDEAAKPDPPGTSDVDENGDEHRRPKMGALRALLCSVALGVLIFFQASNISMLTTTQSNLVEQFQEARDKASWLNSAYLISMSSLTPLMGKIASIFSPRICIFFSAIIMSIGLVLCSFAPSFTVFLAGRAVTGMGGGGTFVVAMIIALEISGHKRRGIAIGLLNSGYTVGVAVGATAAGALVDITGWRPLFWLQIPFVVVAGAVLYFAIPEELTEIKGSGDGALQRLANIDYLGAVTLTGSIVLVLLALSSPSEIPILPIVLAVLVFATFVMIEIHLASDPIIPVKLLKSRGLLFSCLATAGSMMSRWSVLFYAPTYAIAVRQWAPGTAGSILIPTNAGFATGGLLVGWLHVRRPGSFYLPTLVTYTLFPLSLLALALLSTRQSSVVLYVIVVFLNGAITGSMLNYSLAHLLHLTPPSTHFVATALTATFRSFAGSFGSAIGGGIFTRTLYTSLQIRFTDAGLYDREDLIHRLLGLPKLVRQLPERDRAAAILGYQDALRMLFLAAAALALVMIFVQAGTGSKAPVIEAGEEVQASEEERALLAQREDEEDGDHRG